MLQFFRILRKKLIGQGNLRKYIAYSFGEIVLVALGILLALQVNNWNEGKKRKTTEIETYKELKKDLITTAENLHFLEENKSLTNVYYSIKNKAPLTDALKNSFSNFMLYHPVYSRDNTYQSLKLKGMELLSNTNVKDKIVDLYDTEFKWYTHGYMPIEENIVNNAMNFFTKHFETNTENPSVRSMAVPNDYEALLHNKEFLNLLSIMISNRKGLLNWKNDMTDRLQDLIDEIDNEIIVLESN